MSNQNGAKKGRLGKLWSALRQPSSKFSVLSLFVFGTAFGILFWGGFNTAMEATNTLEFCISCHEMRDNVYPEYQKTIHYSNRTGVRAYCSDCHVPKEWTYKMVRKIEASKELWGKLVGTIDTKEKFEAKRLQLARREWARMKANDSRECRNCHGLDWMNLEVQKKRSSKQHEMAKEDGLTCIDCHKGIAHSEPEGMTEEDEAF